jgi:arylsulfatase A-like enzyme
MKHWGNIPVDEGFDQRADITTKKATDFLQSYKEKDGPFFLFAHYFDPHSPYVPPEPFRSRFAPRKKRTKLIEKYNAQYDGEVAFADHGVGILLDTLEYLGRKNDTLIIVTSDHGEGLGQHDYLTHTINIYEEAVRVPLIFHWPGRIPKSRVIKGPVELTDLVPTIFDLIDIKPETQLLQGQSLLNALCNGSELNLDRPVYLHRQHFEKTYMPTHHDMKIFLNGEKFGIRVGDYKYIVGKDENTTELFNLSLDPNELSNIHDALPEKSAELETKLEKWKKENTRQSTEQDTISDMDRKRLESLGYVD